MSIKGYIDNIENFKDGKIIVTGGTAGIGLELVKILAEKEAHIILLARNLSKANKVKENILKEHPFINIDIIQYDQSDYQIIDKAVLEIKEKHRDFISLVANAGILYPNKKEMSKQNHPLTIETNYLGLRRFLEQLIPLFKNKRYVIQGSLVAGSYINKKTNIYSDKYSLFKQYNISKSCVEALWNHYYKNNKDNEFILVEPGITASDIYRGFHQPMRTIGKGFVKIFSHSVKKASLTLLKGLSKDSKNGDYIVPRGIFTIMGYPKNKKISEEKKKRFSYQFIK